VEGLLVTSDPANPDSFDVSSVDDGADASSAFLVPEMQGQSIGH
jgi:hypothetical protein